jgi:plasmid maintenance system antidote protein VapI
MTRFALRTFMLLRDWTAVELAARVPCTPAYIRLLVNGKRKMSAHMSERIRSLPKNAKPVKRKPKEPGYD